MLNCGKPHLHFSRWQPTTHAESSGMQEDRPCGLCYAYFVLWLVAFPWSRLGFRLQFFSRKFLMCLWSSLGDPASEYIWVWVLWDVCTLVLAYWDRHDSVICPDSWQFYTLFVSKCPSFVYYSKQWSSFNNFGHTTSLGNLTPEGYKFVNCCHAALESVKKWLVDNIPLKFRLNGFQQFFTR